MSVRTVKYELEAKLTGISHGFFSKPSGKVERKTYKDGGERLKISVKNLKVPDQAIAVIKADGQKITQLTLINGKGRLDSKSNDSVFIPELESGQTIEVHVGNELMMSGKLYVD